MSDSQSDNHSQPHGDGPQYSGGADSDHSWDDLFLSSMGSSIQKFGSADELEIIRKIDTLAGGRYKLGGILGHGGMGIVVEAEDLLRKMPVAIKILKPSLMTDPDVARSFLNEAEITMQLSHPNIIQVFDVKQDGSTYFLVMEKLEGLTLREQMIQRKKAGEHFSQEETGRLLIAILDALQYAHRFTIHRDIKPENIFICSDGTVKLMDFGISVLLTAEDGKLDAERGMKSGGVGTPYYMAPEQLYRAGYVDNRVDQYSLCAVAYEMLTGHLPAGFSDPIEKARPDVSRMFADFIYTGLQVSAEKRFASVHDMRERLTQVIDEKPGFINRLPRRSVVLGKLKVPSVILLLLLMVPIAVNTFMSIRDSIRENQQSLDSLGLSVREAVEEIDYFRGQLSSQYLIVDSGSQPDFTLADFSFLTDIRADSVELSDFLDRIDRQFRSDISIALDFLLNSTKQRLRELSSAISEFQDKRAFDKGPFFIDDEKFFIEQIQAQLDDLIKQSSLLKVMLGNREFICHFLAGQEWGSEPKGYAEWKSKLDRFAITLQDPAELERIEESMSRWVTGEKRDISELEAESLRSVDAWNGIFRDPDYMPDLSFLYDLKRAMENASRAYTLGLFPLVEHIHQDISGTYAEWLKHWEHHMQLTACAVDGHNDGKYFTDPYGMRFAQIQNIHYLSVTEVRVIDYARFWGYVKGTDSGRNLLETWKSVPYKYGPVSAVGGVPKTDVEFFMSWYENHIQNGDEPHVYAGAELPPLNFIFLIIDEQKVRNGHLGLYRHKEWGYVRIPGHWPNDNLNPMDYSLLPGSGSGSFGHEPFLNLLDNQWEWVWDPPDLDSFPSSNYIEEPRGMLIGTEGFGVATSPEIYLEKKTRFHYVTRVEALGFRIKLSMKDGEPPGEDYNDKFYERRQGL